MINNTINNSIKIFALMAISFVYGIAFSPDTAHADAYINDGSTITTISATPYTSPIVLAGDATITQDAGDTTDYELSGVISGGFNLESDISAGKTIILSGNNTYTGTTTVASGTLQTGSGGTTGTVGAGEVINNDTFKIDRSGTTAMATVVPSTAGISGAGDIDIDINGVLVMNRDISTTAGTLDIFASTGDGSSTGTIRMNDDITIDVGTGSGTIHGVATNNTGRGLQISGTLQVNGDVTFDGDATFTTGTSYGIVFGMADIDSTHGDLVFDGDSLTTAHGSGIYISDSDIDAVGDITLTGDQPSTNTTNVDTNSAGIMLVRRNNLNTTGDVTLSGTGPRGISAHSNTGVLGDISITADNASMTGVSNSNVNWGIVTRHNTAYDISGDFDITGSGSNGVFMQYSPVFDVDGNLTINGAGATGFGIRFFNTPTTTVGGDQTWNGTAAGDGHGIQVVGTFDSTVTGDATFIGNKTGTGTGYGVVFSGATNLTSGNLMIDGDTAGTGQGFSANNTYTENTTGNSAITGDSAGNDAIRFGNTVNVTVGGDASRIGNTTSGSHLGTYHAGQATYDVTGDLKIEGNTDGTNAGVYFGQATSLTADNIDIDGTTALSTINAGVQFNNVTTFNAANDLDIDATAERTHGLQFTNNVTSTVGGSATITGTTNSDGSHAGIYIRGAANTYDGDHTLNGVSTDAGNTWAMGTYFESAAGTTTIDNGTLTINGTSAGDRDILGAVELRQANITGTGDVVINGTATGITPGINIRTTGTYDPAGGIVMNGTSDVYDGVRFTAGANKTLGSDVAIVGDTTSGPYSINMLTNHANNGTLTLDTQSGEGRITGVISGSGDLVKEGDDVFTFSTAHAYAGTTTVNDGALNINGTQTNPAVTTVNTPGVYGGTGSAVASDVTVDDGSIRGGTGLGNTGTLNVGNLTFTDANSQLEVNTNGSNAVSVVDAAGTATLNGMTVNVMEPLAVGVYDIITSTSLIGTAVLGTNNTGNAAYLQYDTSSNTLRLVVAIPGFDVAVVDNITTESGDTGSFTIVMKSQPTADVTIALSSSNTDEGTVQASATFTPADWNIPQTITVTGVDDSPALGDGSVAYNIVTGNVTSSDSIYNALDGSTVDDIAMENENNDPPGISITVVDAETSESGDTATLQFELLSQPLGGADVTIPVSSSNTDEGTLAVTDITILNANWDNPSANELTVTGADDLLADGTVLYTIETGDPTSADTFYDALVASDASDPSISNIDNDVPGFAISESDGFTRVDESGTTDDFTVVLNTQPVTDVVLDIASTDTTEGTIAPTQLTFTNTDWDTPQAVTVTGQDDSLADGDTAYEVQVTINASSDANYLSVGSQSVNVTTADDEVAGFTVTPTSLTVAENAGTDTFTVVLDVEPVEDVTFDLNSSSTVNATVEPTTLTFTPGDWNVAQTVTVTGVENTDSLVDESATITVAVNQAASHDTFDSLASQDVLLTVSDIDDTDNDGSRDAAEDAGTNGGDGNGDGIPDSTQQSVSGVQNPVTGDYTTIEASGACTFVTENAALGETSLTSQDSDYDYPVGLMDFQVQCPSPGQSADVTFYYAQDYGSQTADWVFRKFNSLGGAYADISSLVTFGSHTFTSGPRTGETVTTVSYTITDGDPLTDEDGVADGFINDPAGPAVQIEEDLAETGVATHTPLLFGFILALSALILSYKRKTAETLKD